MKNISKILLLSMVVFLLMVGNSSALLLSELGTQITVGDGQANSGWGGGSNALGIAGEDNETEGIPDTYTYQSWDLEGMFWNSGTNKLYIIGGFNYLGPQSSAHSSIVVGDIFIGNDYVLDLSRDSSGYLTSGGTYNLIQNFDTNEIKPTDVSGSTPFAYSGNATLDTQNINYSAYLINDWANGSLKDLFEPWREAAWGDWINDNHYALEIAATGAVADLINAGNLVHLTLSCGNDTIEGKVAPVPEPATMLLFGSGLIGLAGFGRRKLSKKQK